MLKLYSSETGMNLNLKVVKVKEQTHSNANY